MNFFGASSHQISIQTQQPNLKLAPKPYQIQDGLQHFAGIQDSAEKDKQERLLKDLNRYNKKLLIELKDLNQQLNQVVSKKKRPKGKSSDPMREAPQELKSELSNAYKQIDAYKQFMIQLHNKELSEAEKMKLTDLQNKVKTLDMQIDNLKTQVLLMSNVTREQSKGIQQQRPAQQSVMDLRVEQEQLKTKIRAIKRHDMDEKDYYLKLQKYQVQLQQLLRERMNDDDKAVEPHSQEIGEQEWNIVLNQRKKAVLREEQESQKVQSIFNQIKKEKQMERETCQKIKEREVELERLKRKLKQFSKISKSIERTKPQKHHSMEGHNLSLPQIHDKKKQLNSIPEIPTIKKWVPISHIEEVGLTGPQATFFSDRKILASHNLTKVKKVQIFINSKNEPCALLCQYVDSLSEYITRQQTDLKPFTQNKSSQVLIFSEEDYLKVIAGQIDRTHITFLKLSSDQGREIKVGREGTGRQFVLKIDQEELPSRLHWAVSRKDGEPFLCLLGCEVIPCW